MGRITVRLTLRQWDSSNQLYFTVTSYKIGRQGGECEPSRSVCSCVSIAFPEISIYLFIYLSIYLFIYLPIQLAPGLVELQHGAGGLAPPLHQREADLQRAAPLRQGEHPQPGRELHLPRGHAGGDTWQGTRVVTRDCRRRSS